MYESRFVMFLSANTVRQIRGTAATDSSSAASDGLYHTNLVKNFYDFGFHENFSYNFFVSDASFAYGCIYNSGICLTLTGINNEKKIYVFMRYRSYGFSHFM